jgi:hypothetical protein
MKSLFVSMSPRVKLLLACGLILGVSALASPGGVSASSVARGLLGAAALAGLGWWLLRRGRTTPGFALPEPLRVVSRAGLSPRCGLALVEVEGSRYLVAFGDSFAEIRRMHVPVRVGGRGRRPVLQRRGVDSEARKESES